MINVHDLLICPPLALQNFKPAVSPERSLSLSSNFSADAWKTNDHKGLVVACSVSNSMFYSTMMHLVKQKPC